tara:strand:+ start:154 stop:993 length:840 start_codon:yes stop_codon:yes gene_type:complete
MSIKDITIVITSFKSENKIKECLNSIDKHCKIINVENSNNVDYKSQIENEFKNVKCILTGENLGYGKANNIGLKEVKTKYALILNPDTKLYPETLNSFISLANDIKNFAIIGPGIIEGDDLHKIAIKQEAKETNTVKGYAMLMNLSQFEDIGFFDENIFFFLEEIDLCKRLKRKNKIIYYSPNTKVHHEGGKSHDNSYNYEMELSRNWHWMWSTFYYNKKHNGYLIALLIILPKLFTTTFKFFIYSIFKNKEKKEIYKQRYLGLINSILGKTSWYRPKV